MENYFARQDLVLDAETGGKIKKARILVIGAGAGGNEVLKDLALMGFGNFTIVDFDPIESSNLSRTTLFSKEDIGKNKAEAAAEALRRIALHEDSVITAYNTRIQELGRQIFLDHDFVVCCVDTRSARAYISDWCVRLNKVLLEMGFDRFVVQVSCFLNASPNDPCLREMLGSDKDDSSRMNSCSKLRVTDHQLIHIPTIQVAAALAGAFLAAEIIFLLQGNSRLGNKLLQYSAEYHLCAVFNLVQSAKCTAHSNPLPDIVDSPLHNSSTIGELLSFAKETLKEDFLLRLEDDLILGMDCESCGVTIPVGKFRSDVYDHERWCKDCLEAGKYEELPISRNWSIIREINLLNINHVPLLQKQLSAVLFHGSDLVKIDSLHDLNKSCLIKIQ